jgi:hypothetical protein
MHVGVEFCAAMMMKLLLNLLLNFAGFFVSILLITKSIHYDLQVGNINLPISCFSTPLEVLVLSLWDTPIVNCDDDDDMMMMMIS